MIKVVNKHHGGKGEYIGRGSPLGNPFSHLPGTKAQFAVATRDDAIDAYRKWLNEQIVLRNPAVLSELWRLYQILVSTGHLSLMCFCAPKACHGEVIKQVLEEAQRNGTSA